MARRHLRAALQAPTRLARSELYEQQAFVIGRAYALQFHLEVDSGLARSGWPVPEYVEELKRLGDAGTRARLLAEVADVEAASVPLARALFGRWLVEVAGIPPA